MGAIVITDLVGREMRSGGEEGARVRENEIVEEANGGGRGVARG